MHSPSVIFLLSCVLVLFASAIPLNQPTSHCRNTTVLILGAGVSGIAAAQALSNQSINEFLILDRNDYIGGRVAHTTFGTKPDGTPYVVELGANWVQGLGSPGGPENPIWTFTKKYGVANTYSNYSSIRTYNETGATDLTQLTSSFDDAYTIAEQHAGNMLKGNLQDVSTRTGFSLAGWKPRKHMGAQALEWFEWDWEVAYPPEESAFVFGIAGYNLTFYQYSEENNFVADQRGFNRWIAGEAGTFLVGEEDPRLVLGTIVERIVYADDKGVTVYNSDGSCITAAYAVCTFSLGVLQNEVVAFEPPLPPWKQMAIESFQMGTYTKIFLQFNETFWDPDTQFFLYADPKKRGYYPVFQSLSTAGFLPGSNIIFVTVVGDESYRVEQQSDEETRAEIMEVLRVMFPEKDIPEPVDFMYPRWSLEPWAHGSYSNWPVGMTLEMHQNLRANVGRLWFSGEHCSAEYFGFLHGAWFEGREVGERIAAAIRQANSSESMARYEVLHGTTEEREFNATNGWSVSSFLSYGFE